MSTGISPDCGHQQEFERVYILGRQIEGDRRRQRASGLADNRGFADVAPLDVLNCLVARQGNVGPLPRLDAAVQAAIESNAVAEELSPALEQCEYPDGS